MSDKAPKEEQTEVGTLLAGRYEVTREIGRGGMGIVYLCKDIVTGERVALKRLRAPDESKAQSREEESWWFQQEARAVASLDHPAIVRARDFGTLSDGSPYLVMDALPGRSVHEWMHTTTMPWSVIWVLADQVMAGLGHAHARGVIHGDLKPSNVMLDLASAGRGPRAFVLDLGLAWLRESRHDPRLDGAPEPELAVHSGAGTVGWVAPEQIRKAAAHVGPPTDLYALGCILYRVLTGKEVFEGNAQEVLRAHKRTPVAPPLLPEGVPAGVADFVVRLLAKKPWHRFELAADARRAWNHFRPKHAATMEETIARMPAPPPAAPSSEGLPERGRAVAAARALAPGLLSLRPSPMVARERERAELMALVQEVGVRGGTQPANVPPTMRFIALIGQAGVGKSRLAEWLCETLAEQGRMWVLRARYGRIASPLDGLTGAINKFFNLQGADRNLVEQTLMNRWEVEKDDDEALTWVAATAEWLRPTAPGEIVPVGPTGKRYVLDNPELRFAVIRRVLERIAYDRPLFIWFDDLHLSSPNTFDVLVRLRREARVPLLIVATARSEALETDLDAALRMESLRADWNGKVMDLQPLGDEETHVLLRATLPLHSEAIQSATRQSRGNPLFALQLLHAWAGGGYLTMEAGRYRVPREALQGRAITTAELWDERLRGVPTGLRLAAYAAAAVGDDVRGVVLKALAQSLGMDPREALVALTRAQIVIATGNDQFRWAHALLQEHLLARLHERNDHPAIFRLAANALALHPAVGSRRVMKLRVTNLLRAGDDDVAAQLMFRFIEGAWARGRDTAATLRDLATLEGRVNGATAAEYAYWRAEALRHTGRLEQAKEQAETALRAFETGGQRTRQAHAKRLLGHLHSDMGQPATGRVLVERALELFTQLRDARGYAQALVVLGEIDYLLGNHDAAAAVLLRAERSCAEAGDELGRAQSLILLAMIQTSVGGYVRAVDLLVEARGAFDQIGYRLGIAQCDVVLGHADHRARKFPMAWARAETARVAFRELVNPRGEAAAERLLSMIALDTERYTEAREHAETAARIFEKLQDPWGDLETRLLLAQVALATGAGDAQMWVARCDEIVLEEAEPRQHRHLTRAWLFQTQSKWTEAAAELDAARAAYSEKGRSGDHTPQLLHRFSQLAWKDPAAPRLTAWLSFVEAQDHGESDLPQSSEWPLRAS
jgi:tetratricopeptide (TPR) repeat protein